MKWLTAPRIVLACVSAALAVVACRDGSSDTDASGQDVTAVSACTVVSVKDGHTMTATELAKLNDPVANLVLKGDGCPLTLTEIQAKLTKTDPCDKGEEGLTTRLVTDRAQLLERPDAYRATKTDDKGAVTDVSVPDATVELIGEQKGGPQGNGDAAPLTGGVFNFYAREDNQWKFFGSSADFVSQGYECNDDGACIPKAATNQRCASCHVGGGLVMKELQSPWVNWEGDRDTPGVKEIIAKKPTLFGAQGNGVDLEGSVEDGNAGDWVPTRVSILKKLGLKEVLRPLFCSTDMNLVSRTLPGPQGFLFDTAFPTTRGGVLVAAEYTAALTAANQHIVDGRSGGALIGANGKPVVDTLFGFTVPARSTQDTVYVKELQNQQIVDIDFVKDVLVIDFTRPLYSRTRCDLLDGLPDVPEADMHFAKVKAAVIQELTGTEDPIEQQLLANLQNPLDAAVHDLAITKFIQACDARHKSEPTAYANDLLRYASHVRNAAKRARNETNGGIIEFAETLPEDDLTEPTDGFDPVTCELP